MNIVNLLSPKLMTMSISIVNLIIIMLLRQKAVTHARASTNCLNILYINKRVRMTGPELSDLFIDSY